MCRLLGVVASERTDFQFSLRTAPRSLATLSREHPHGWGVAVFASSSGWSVEKRAVCAFDDDAFARAAAGTRGELLVAHIRKKTVGPTRHENTHPFRRGRWVFAHNGTIDDVAHLREASSPARRAEIVGDTDSELFLAYLLTRLDAANLADRAAGPLTDAALLRAMRDALARPGFGACNFILSDGETMYAHRAGRSLFLLERRPGDEVLSERRSVETGAVLATPWTNRRRAVLVASEKTTSEPWQEVEEGELWRIDRVPEPVKTIVGATL